MTFCSHCGAELLKEDKNFCSKCGSSLRHHNKVSTQGKRFINYIIDYVGFFIFAVIIVILLDITGLYTALGLYQLNETFLGLLLVTFYYLFFETLYQKTPAKFLTKTKVVMENGQKPDFNHIFGRTLSRFIPFEPLSFLFNPVGWHDSISGTLVVPDHYTEDDVKKIKRLPNKENRQTILIIIVVGTIVLGLASSVVLLALNSARAKSRDAKRLADVRQLATALELYYNDKAFYPFSLQTLKPNYVTALPSAPLPPDGQCTPSDNEYYFYNIGAYHY